MKLYEINEEISHLMEHLQPDAETGEVSDNTDEIMEQLDALGMERQSVLEWFANEILNIRAEVEMVKADQEQNRSDLSDMASAAGRYRMHDIMA